MRIRFKVEGGIAFFPGLSGPVAIDSGELPEEEAAELKRRVGEARFFELPPEVGKPRPGAADLRQYAISIEDGARSHTIWVVEPVGDPYLRTLVEALDAKAKTLRRVARAGDAEETTGE